MACRHIPVSEPNSIKIVNIHVSEPHGVKIVPLNVFHKETHKKFIGCTNFTTALSK